MSDYLFGHQVPSLSINQIRDLTNKIREVTEIKEDAAYPVLHFLELGMPEIFENYDWEIIDQLSNDKEACCYPDGCKNNPNGPYIQIKESIYNQANLGDGRARFTITHEIGHVFLHRGVPSVHNRLKSGSELKPYENSEWQANTFAGELLMPLRSFLVYDNIFEYCKQMQVTKKAAITQGNKLARHKDLPKHHWIFDIIGGNAMSIY